MSLCIHNYVKNQGEKHTEGLSDIYVLKTSLGELQTRYEESHTIGLKEMQNEGYAYIDVYLDGINVTRKKLFKKIIKVLKIFEFQIEQLQQAIKDSELSIKTIEKKTKHKKTPISVKHELEDERNHIHLEINYYIKQIKHRKKWIKRLNRKTY